MKQFVQTGFTLIELMIVVATLGILAAVALPLYQDYTTKTKWASNLADLESLKSAIRICMNDKAGDGTQCDTVNKLNEFGFAGNELPKPKYGVAATAVVLTGTAASGATPGKVNVTFTGASEVGGWVYSADCAKDTDGNLRCIAATDDNIPTKLVAASSR